MIDYLSSYLPYLGWSRSAPEIQNEDEKDNLAKVIVEEAAMSTEKKPKKAPKETIQKEDDDDDDDGGETIKEMSTYERVGQSALVVALGGTTLGFSYLYGPNNILANYIGTAFASSSKAATLSLSRPVRYGILGAATLAALATDIIFKPQILTSPMVAISLIGALKKDISILTASAQNDQNINLKRAKQFVTPVGLATATVGATMGLGEASILTNYIGGGFAGAVKGVAEAVPRLPRYIGLGATMAGAIALDHYVPLAVNNNQVAWTPMAAMMVVASLKKEVKAFTSTAKQKEIELQPVASAKADDGCVSRVATTTRSIYKKIQEPTVLRRIKNGIVATTFGALTYGLSYVTSPSNLLTNNLAGNFASQSKDATCTMPRSYRYGLLGGLLTLSLHIDHVWQPPVPITPLASIALIGACKKEIKWLTTADENSLCTGLLLRIKNTFGCSQPVSESGSER